MRALSVLEPWATLIMHYGKDIENRTWYMKWRGPLVICASARIEPGWDQMYWDSLLSYISDEYIEKWNLPREWKELKSVCRPGYALGTVNVVGCKEGPDNGSCTPPWEQPWQFHIKLTNAIPFTTPFPQKGQLGIFHVSDSLVKGAA